MKELNRIGKPADYARDPFDPARDYAFLALLLTPAAVDGLWNIRFDSKIHGLLVTYLFDALPLVLLATAPRYWWAFRECAMARIDLKWTLIFVPVFAVLAVVILRLEIAIQLTFIDPSEWTRPLNGDRPWYWFDMTFGLTLGAITEELTYRGIFAAILFRRGAKTWLVVLLSSLIFALLHWPSGIAAIITAFLFGLLLMAVYLKTRSIWPGVILHTIYNIAVFA